MFGCQDITRAGDHEKVFAVADNQYRLQFLQVFFGASVLDLIHVGVGELPRRGFEFAV